MILSKCDYCGHNVYIVWDKDEDGNTVSSHATCEYCMKNVVIPQESINYWRAVRMGMKL